MECSRNAAKILREYSRKTDRKCVFLIKNHVFLSKNEGFGGSWGRWGPGQESGGPKRGKRQIGSPLFGGCFGTFSALFGVCFFVYFQVPSFSALWAVWEPKGAQKGCFGRSF